MTTEHLADIDGQQWGGLDGSTAAFAGAIEPPSPTGPALTWSPPDTTGYTTVNVPTSGYTGTPGYVS